MPNSSRETLNLFADYVEQVDSPTLGEFVAQLGLQVSDATASLLIQLDINRRTETGSQVPWAEYRQLYPDLQNVIAELECQFSRRPSDDDRQAPNKDESSSGSDIANDATIPPAASNAEDLTVPPGESPRVQNQLSPNGDQDESEEIFANYQLIKELARGGMGVVYRARDKRLNRLVALKMVLAGSHASEEDRIRFNIEASAAAQLDHPAITPIYEVGEHEGKQFFAMKLVEGGSMEDILEQLPDDPRRAARLVAQIAEGIHHAHQRGTLHRDLKPQNILLDNDEQPLITDFGLAKLTDGDSSMTRTGVAMGTPAYMPPEQALGDRNVTTSADIYSLGAILYAALTGRPPHQGGSAMETMLQVIDGEIEKPSSLRSKVPIELELIAIKCLQKEPQQRYASAAEIADDLNNWLDGKPVSVRPPSVASQARQWLKHNIRMASLSLLTGCLIAALAVPLCLAGFEQSGLPGSIYREIPQTQAPIFAGVQLGIREDLTDGWKLLTVALAVMLVSSAGAISVALLRPKTMNEAVGVGIMSGIAVGITLFLLFFGWMVAGNATGSFTSGDVQLLANIANEQGEQKQRAMEKLSWRYPDLASRPEAEKINFVQRKIAQDSILMTGLGNLLAAIVSLMFFIPVVFAGAYCFRLYERFDSRLRRLAGHLEFILISVLLSLAMVWMMVTIVVQWLPSGVMNGPKPNLLHMLICTLASLVALRAIWQFQHAAIRLTLNALAFACFIWFASSVFTSGSLDRDVMAAIEKQDYQAAAARFDLQTRQGGIWTGSASSSLVMAAMAEDWSAYETYWDQFAKQQTRGERTYYETTTAIHLETMLLAPLSPEELKRLDRIVDFVERFATPELNGTHYHYVLALANYRKGKLETALAQLNQVPVEGKVRYLSEKDPPSSYLLDDQKSFALRAMIYHQLGRNLESKEELEKLDIASRYLSDNWFPKYLKADRPNRHNSMMNAYFALQVMRREALQTIKDNKQD